MNQKKNKKKQIGIKKKKQIGDIMKKKKTI